MPRISHLPKKAYYKISEVASICGIKPHVLRYWELEFSLLKPKKNRGGRRAYTETDIWVIREIKKLLYEERFTIDGAKKKLSTPGGRGSNHFQVAIPFDDHRAKEVLKIVKKEIEDLLKILEEGNSHNLRTK
ncbi:MerR family transcriptional regulator [candidate division TA06 bacterium]|nr:MerR family transcriptional regulator [candidate division TA06 bacterium]